MRRTVFQSCQQYEDELREQKVCENLTAYPPPKVKLTVIVVSTSVGSPFKRYGL
jgi:hypothetical protein